MRVGDTIHVQYSGVITSNGTGSGAIIISMPFTVTGAFILSGRGAGVSGKMLQGYVSNGSSLAVYNYDGSYPGANGETIVLSGTLRLAS
jgi:hypothetical protein